MKARMEDAEYSLDIGKMTKQRKDMARGLANLKGISTSYLDMLIDCC